jgi:predicted transcriptional regulator
LTQLQASQPSLSQEDITTNHAFDTRQTQYYTNAGAYLGLVERKQSRAQGVTYSLTEKGFRIMAKKFRARNLSLVQAVLEHGVFNQVLRLYMQQGTRPLREQVEAIMRTANLEGLGKETSTIPRRAQTVLAWLDWIIELTRR